MRLRYKSEARERRRLGLAEAKTLRAWFGTNLQPTFGTTLGEVGFDDFTIAALMGSQKCSNNSAVCRGD